MKWINGYFIGFLVYSFVFVSFERRRFNAKGYN